MPGECDECGEQALESICDKAEFGKLTVREICVSEEIQSRLAPIVTNYLDNKRPLIDALEWVLQVIVNDERHGLECYRNVWERKPKNKIDIEHDAFIIRDVDHYLHPERKMVEGEEDSFGGYICRVCAFQMGAIPPKNHVCTWHVGICDFCSKKANLCHTTDWSWPEFPDRETGGEF